MVQAKVGENEDRYGYRYSIHQTRLLAVTVEEIANLSIKEQRIPASYTTSNQGEVGFKRKR